MRFFRPTVAVGMIAWVAGCGGTSPGGGEDAGGDGQVADADARVVDGAVGGCVHPVVAAACAGGWCRIPAGCFTMGSPASEPCRRTSEDAHQVTLTREFEIQRTEVTQAEFQLRMGYNPSSLDGMNCGASCPVQRVNKHEAMAYCNAQSVAAGKVACYSCTGTGAGVTCLHAAAFGAEQIYGCPGYRLPTDAEWEYAYRAGTTTAYPSGANDATKCTTCSEVDPNADSIGWYCANYANLPSHPVAQKQANAWGLHDMAGNVIEWCDDAFKFSLGTAAATDPWNSGSSNDTVRGGNYGSDASSLRAASRQGGVATTRLDSLGFRCARTLD